MIKIQLHRKENCALCLEVIKFINICKIYCEFELEYVEDVEESPVTIFYSAEKKISQFSGVPMNDKPEETGLILLRYLLQGLYDSYLEEGERKLELEVVMKQIDLIALPTNAANKINTKEEFSEEQLDKVSLKVYGYKHSELCKMRQNTILTLLRTKYELQDKNEVK